MRAGRLLHDASTLLAANPRLLRAAGAVRSFHDGARWMRLAMRSVRGRRVPRITRSLEGVGWRKYGLCVALNAGVALALIVLRAAWLLPLCVPIFYLCEVQRVFDVPLAIDGRPSRSNAALIRASGGTARAVCTVMTLACVMLFGGLAGGGFVRAWCLGCAAVVIWYERLRSPRATARTRVDRRRFEFGAAGPILLRRERVTMPIDRPARLLFASDLHLGNRWSPRVVDEIVRHLRAERPDALLLGGDLADSRAGLPHLRRLLTAARETTATIAAVLGNHDRWADGLPIVATLDAFGVARLDDRAICLDDVTIVGSDAALTASHASRTVLVAHDPARHRRDIRVTLAGHLHGGQCVWWTRGSPLWPGWLINRHTVLRRDDGASTLIVSRGAADSLPLRFNCPREVVLVELTPCCREPA